jgi:hypothetical protein
VLLVWQILRIIKNSWVMIFGILKVLDNCELSIHSLMFSLILAFENLLGALWLILGVSREGLGEVFFF